jgi:hypothetical protein
MENVLHSNTLDESEATPGLRAVVTEERNDAEMSAKTKDTLEHSCRMMQLLNRYL